MTQNQPLNITCYANASHNKVVPIVLLHGWGLNSGVWQPLLSLFKQSKSHSYQFITIDLPGFGTNSKVDIAPYSLQSICDSINQTISQPAIYLGWSLGGLVATEMALSYPDKVLGLISVASSPYFVAQENWPGIKESVLANFHRQLAEDPAKTISGFLKIQAMGSPHIRQDLKLISSLVMEHPLPSKNILDQSLDLLSHCDLRAQLADISVPFLRFYGSNDTLVPKAVIEKINSLVPNSDQHTFNQASHAPFISHLDDFYTELLAWLEQHS